MSVTFLEVLQNV